MGRSPHEFVAGLGCIQISGQIASIRKKFVWWGGISRPTIQNNLGLQSDIAQFLEVHSGIKKGCH
jgi:hypothetical protein